MKSSTTTPSNVKGSKSRYLGDQAYQASIRFASKSVVLVVLRVVLGVVVVVVVVVVVEALSIKLQLQYRHTSKTTTKIPFHSNDQEKEITNKRVGENEYGYSTYLCLYQIGVVSMRAYNCPASRVIFTKHL